VHSRYGAIIGLYPVEEDTMEDRDTIPVKAMDTDQQALDAYLVQLTKPYGEFTLAVEEEDDE
jgi:hypothetical protein